MKVQKMGQKKRNEKFEIVPTEIWNQQFYPFTVIS